MSSTLAQPHRAKRRTRIWLAAIAVIAIALPLISWWVMIRMPGKSFQGELSALSDPQTALRDELRRDVDHLSLRIGERNLMNYPALIAAAKYVDDQFIAAGYKVERQEFKVRDLTCANLIVEIPGTTRPDEIVVVGGHYDTAPGTPGANDNASGTAAMLALARRFADSKPARTLRFVAFTNEEPPYFQTQAMGSWVYAWRCNRRNEKIVAALSLETIGYYTSKPNSQKYPGPFDMVYPAEGNFIGVIGNVGSRQLVRQIVAAFREHGQFPSEGAAIPANVVGVGWSDHWSFWQAGYPGVMITDTAPFRYPYYHLPGDLPEQINFDHIARIVTGLEGVVKELVK